MPKKISNELKSRFRYQQAILAIAIAVVVVSFVTYAISVFYEKPDYEDYCTYEILSKVRQNKTLCEEQGWQWQENALERPPCPSGEKCDVEGWCDAHSVCREEFEEVNKVYGRNVFLIGSILGLVTLLVGLVLKLTPVSVGISTGGVILITISILKYWNEFGKYARLLLLGFLLMILILAAYKKFGNNKNK